VTVADVLAPILAPAEGRAVHHDSARLESELQPDTRDAGAPSSVLTCRSRVSLVEGVLVQDFPAAGKVVRGDENAVTSKSS
jgi:hypothetical protein